MSMRKQLKNKKKSCALCKPHKRKWENRWTKKEQEELKKFNKDKLLMLCK